MSYGDEPRYQLCKVCGAKDCDCTMKDLRNFQAGAASRDAEVASLKTVPMQYRRMAFNAQLQDEVAKLEADRLQQIDAKTNFMRQLNAVEEERDQLRANINKLREALGKHVTELMNISVSNGANSVSMPDDYVATALLLASIPEQSLAEYRNKVIEECAKQCEAPNEYGFHRTCDESADAIRDMKEQP